MNEAEERELDSRIGANMAATLLHGIAGVGRFLRKELVAAWPVFLLFLTGFVLLTLLLKAPLAVRRSVLH